MVHRRDAGATRGRHARAAAGDATSARAGDTVGAPPAGCARAGRVGRALSAAAPRRARVGHRACHPCRSEDPAAPRRRRPRSPGGAHVVAATQEGARGNGPASTSSRTVATPTGMQGPRTSLWGRAASAVDQLGPGSTLGRYELLMPVAQWRHGGRLGRAPRRAPAASGRSSPSRRCCPTSRRRPRLRGDVPRRGAARVADPAPPTWSRSSTSATRTSVLYIVMEWVDGETVASLHKAGEVDSAASRCGSCSASPRRSAPACTPRTSSATTAAVLARPRPPRHLAGRT